LISMVVKAPDLTCLRPFSLGAVLTSGLVAGIWYYFKK
jgi:hypothetical protein